METPLGFYVNLPDFFSNSDDDELQIDESALQGSEEVAGSRKYYLEIKQQAHDIEEVLQITEAFHEIREIAQVKTEFPSPEPAISPKKRIKKVYVCDRCACEFAGKKTLEKHLLRHLTEKNFWCITCGRNYWGEFNFKRHQSKHLSLSPITCAACSKTYTDFHSFESHIVKFHTKTGCFTCSKCDFTTKTYYGLYNHKMGHLDNNIEKNFSCSKCHESFPTKAQLRVHCKNVENSPRLLCNICGRSFTTVSLKNTHMKEAHADLEVHDCPECDKTFGNIESIILHEIMHERNREIECKHCSKKIKKKFLKSHKCS